MVVNGNVRDAPRLLRERWPIWATGFNPVGCWNTKPRKPAPPDPIALLEEKYRNAVAVCDDSGVVVIPDGRIGPQFLEKLKAMELQEDQWYECIDRRKWNTFETICLRAYE